MIECNVLVIGGGMAGCFAAVKAREQGLNVLLVDKGYVSRSGETPYAGDTAVFDPAWGHDLGQWLEQVNVVGEYMNNRHWNELVFRDSRERFADLRSWGVKFLEKDGEVVRLPHPYKNIDLPDKDKFPPIVSEVVHWLPSHTDPMRKHVIRSGIKLKDRFMVTELLKQEDRVVGAIGFSIEGNEPQVIKAKAVALCAGGGGFRPIGYPTHEMTADGHVMAYRVGAVITSKEFVAPHSTNPEQPAWPPMYLFFSSGGSAALPGMYQLPKLQNAVGDLVPARGMAWHGWIDAEFEAHEGRAPLTADLGRRGVHQVSGPGAHGSMLGHATAGVVPVDDDCATKVPGLMPPGTVAAPASSARPTRGLASPPCTPPPQAPGPGSAPRGRLGGSRPAASTSGSRPPRRRGSWSRGGARAVSRRTGSPRCCRTPWLPISCSTSRTDPGYRPRSIPWSTCAITSCPSSTRATITNCALPTRPRTWSPAQR